MDCSDRVAGLLMVVKRRVLWETVDEPAFWVTRQRIWVMSLESLAFEKTLDNKNPLSKAAVEQIK